ncbi:hypothetical protein HX052_07105 [Myroides marinus]|uniref:hypothetical protein n=1 Tax=Myroides marinus TaxID=703342 RepID=UPI002576A0A5|nr:hypothetical protein [Myroides marinus]MDM1367699.1 hypothetical protein [Myroides marinus]MDM1373462.1 hypothetical protein [Myroides marinus]MDM1375955.1 hypothetical protein [Myroides marinus]MDM1382424.1 hypothetical protein [Myroides marinus]MDM1389735.1 hypothetical protein [Myroides marinus]
MRLATFDFTPFEIKFSFHRLINAMHQFIDDPEKNEMKKTYFKDLLDRVSQVPSLLEPIIEPKILHDNAVLINELLEILFPIALTDNEIKAVGMPFQNLMFNHSRRFKKIIEESGGNYNIEIRDFNQHQYYIACCCIIMNHYFKASFDLTRPLFIDLPDERGIIHHYRVLYNADFVEVVPKENAVMLSKEDIELLEDNFDNFELWVEKFPQHSWQLNGFGIINLVDVTIENALSLLKENFLKSELQCVPIGDIIEPLFSSIFKVPNLQIGFTPLVPDIIVQKETNEMMAMSSFLLDEEEGTIVLSKKAYNTIVNEHGYYSISDVDLAVLNDEDAQMCLNLQAKGVKSCLFSPVVISSGVEGVLEIISTEKRVLNSVNAQKLNALMPIISETFERVKSDMQNYVEAIIQREFTTIHPSVYWKFIEEARRNYIESVVDKDSFINPISFKNVYPLYGEIDIKGSGALRNEAILSDLREQLQKLIAIFNNCALAGNALILERHILKLEAYLRQLEVNFISGLEQRIQTYVTNEIHTYLMKEEHLFCKNSLEEYFTYIDRQLGIYYRYRKIYDTQVGKMNKSFSDLLDYRQEAAQKVFPHYYERFKTDGVEHNLYIGSSICPTMSFDFTYLHNLRLWQLQAMSELMCVHYRNNIQDALTMDVTVLILVYDSSLGIQFRMDEKRFDIDGSYNTRYEIIKKRLDKACIKGSTERIVQPKKITIAFASNYHLEEYLGYIEFGQKIGLLDSHLEQFLIEDMQSVSGLIGIRIGVNLDYDVEDLDYDTLMHRYLKSQYL